MAPAKVIERPSIVTNPKPHKPDPAIHKDQERVKAKLDSLEQSIKELRETIPPDGVEPTKGPS